METILIILFFCDTLDHWLNKINLYDSKHISKVKLLYIFKNELRMKSKNGKNKWRFHFVFFKGSDYMDFN